MREMREAAGITQTELARRLRIRGLPYHQQTVQRVEVGDRPIRLDEAFHIAAELETHLDVMVQPGRPGVADAAVSFLRLRRESEQLIGEITDATADWVDSFHESSADFAQILEYANGLPTIELRWAAAWMLKATPVMDAINDVLFYLNGIVSQSSTWRETAPQILAPPFDGLAEWDIWASVPEQLRPDALADLSSADLDEYLKGTTPSSTVAVAQIRDRSDASDEEFDREVGALFAGMTEP